MTELPASGEPSVWLAAVVDNSFDAILSKTLDGVITSWNGAAEQLFGFSSDEAIGRSITIIIPDDRLDEEAHILSRLRSGASVERFETVRRHRDGRLIDIELTVSPVRASSGEIIGASKIARDISARKRRREEQALMLSEMHHRIKNLLAVIQSLMELSRRSAPSVDVFVRDLSDRIGAFAAAHQLTLVDPDGNVQDREASLDDLLNMVLAPFAESGRMWIEGVGPKVDSAAVTNIALLFHELATNAVKYGALSVDKGRLEVTIEPTADATLIAWREIGVAEPDFQKQGFGTRLIQMAAQALGAKIDRRWDADTLVVEVLMPIRDTSAVGERGN